VAETQPTPAAQDKETASGNDQQPEPSLPPNTRSKVVTLRPPEPKSERGGNPTGPSNPPNPPPLRGGGGSSRGSLTVQVGSFKDQGEADARAASLNAATNGEFHVVKAVIPGMGVWYRVQQVQGFGSREAALGYGNRLRAKNLVSDFIVTGR
jgi:cell division protein FtsN